MKWRLQAVILVFALAFTPSAGAHPVPYSYIDIQLQRDMMEISLVVHIFDVAHDLAIVPAERLLDPGEVSRHAGSIRGLLGPRVQFKVDGALVKADWSAPEIVSERQSLRLRYVFPAKAIPGILTINANLFPYEPEHQTFVNVYENNILTSQRILDRDRTQTDYFGGTRPEAKAVMGRFIPEGIRHILIGPDHLLFLVGLLLLGGTLRRLLVVVTSFTVAHSVTLSLAALNILNPPARIIEPAIALSIVYVGLDNLLSKQGRDVRAWIALAFGFIHGFGFANVLREMGLPAKALGWSLFSFNLGVEIGQLMVVTAVASALTAVRSRNERAGHQLAFAGSIVVIVAGAFWFVRRVFFPGGI